VERYVIRGGRAGYDRLRVLAAARRASTLELFQLAGLRPGMRCVDLGCGSGDVTLDIAALAGPGGWVAGIDMDQAKLEFARQAARERGLANVAFEAADVSQWTGPGEYDFVYCRFLLQHLASPAGLLRQMWDAVRPGGVLAVEDADLEGLFCDPDNAGFSFYRRMYLEVLARNGGDPTCARRLARYFRETGIPAPAMRLLQGVNAGGDAKAMPLLTLYAIADAIVSSGLAAAAEVTAAIENLRAFTTDPDTLISDPRIFQVWARRGTGDATAVPQEGTSRPHHQAVVRPPVARGTGTAIAESSAPEEDPLTTEAPTGRPPAQPLTSASAQTRLFCSQRLARAAPQ
jgi:ubiquinone/menaquinone biosynthesis C-methylase UbiE